jgi:hypothetical protein
MRHSDWLLIATVVFANANAQAQQATLTLACNGTFSGQEEKPEPISMGIIVNFTARTVQGFNSPGYGSYPVMINGENDVTISFYGSRQSGDVEDSVSGSIDRVTGDVWAENRTFNVKSGNGFTTTYTLKCKPAQRLF